MLPSWRDVALWVWCQKALGPIKMRRGRDQTLLIEGQVFFRWDEALWELCQQAQGLIGSPKGLLQKSYPKHTVPFWDLCFWLCPHRGLK